eukprot:10953475-Alexandrium_andersonii.AAC.1
MRLGRDRRAFSRMVGGRLRGASEARPRFAAQSRASTARHGLQASAPAGVAAGDTPISAGGSVGE